MPRYNVNFELSVEDMDLIEGALRRSKSELSAQRWNEDSLPDHGSVVSSETEGDEELRRIHDLLGRLHNQKVFYRPKAATYISG